MLWRAVRVAAILLLALFLFAQYLRRTGMFFPDRYPSGHWDAHAYGVAPRDETFVTRDGVTLHGWLFRANDRASPLIVWFHGNGGNITDRAPVAAELARRGVAVFVFDWRGYGKSEGSPSESKLYRDALAAYDFAATRTRDLALYGESLGGPYAAYVAMTRGHVRCVLIENSFPSLAKLGNALYRPLPLGWIAPLALRTTAWLNNAGLPVLVLHGKRDQVIPFALGQELYDGLRVPKQMFVCESGGHCEIPSVEGDRYYDAVVNFVTDTSRTRSYR